MDTQAAHRQSSARRRTLAVLLVLAVTGGSGLAAPAPATPEGRARPEQESRAQHRHGHGDDDDRAERPRTIQWSPARVRETVGRGGTKTELVSFSSRKVLSDVSLSVSRDLAPYVTASPSFIPSIEAGTTTTVTLTFSAPLDARLRAHDGTLRLHANGKKSKRIHASPLPVKVRIVRGHLPIANAGPDQTSGVEAGDAVFLDGSRSSDPDGQPLTFSWSLTVVPAGSTAALSDPAAVDPSFIADTPGTYTARLTVNDGFVESKPDDVSITVVVPPPTVQITAPENLAVVTASPVTVTGTVDDPNATITANGQPVANNAGNYTAAVPLTPGSNTVTVIAQNSTGEGSASVDVILTTGLHPVVKITSPGRGFIVGEEFPMGVTFPAHTSVAVEGVIKVSTSVLFGNTPSVRVNDVEASVQPHIFNSLCGLLDIIPPFQCFKFNATIALAKGERTITAVGTDVEHRSTEVSVGGIVDYCRIGNYFSEDSSASKDPGVLALAGIDHNQGNRCHEIDGCSTPTTPQKCGDDPMGCPLGGAGTILHNPTLPVPALHNQAPTAFGQGGPPPLGFGNAPEEHFVHGRQSRHFLACNRHDVCYQTCVPVVGLTDAESEAKWLARWHECNERQQRDMHDTCNQAYPARCPHRIIGDLPDPVACLLYFREKATCALFVQTYFLGVESPPGLNAFKQRQMDYCVD